MIDELAELVEMYEQGAWSRGDYFYRITLLVPDVSVGELIQEIPISDHDDFVCWLRQTYDNDVPADNFISIGGQGDTALTRERIDSLRGWLRANPVVDGSTTCSS
ncbi:MAG TPA: hypothetical protein VFD36_01120 [Kofleriaceae bacterium]|nr:hypothetical protein [Kofleriaceae bacterium]